jgi:hypothetical protein
MHRFLNIAQSPGWCSRFGGGGDAGTAEHHCGLSGAAGVDCCAPALATMRYEPTSASATTRRVFIIFLARLLFLEARIVS